MSKRILHLHLKGEYFDQILAGTKTEEYRLVSVWKKRLEGRQFDEVWLYRGYPKRGDESKVIRRPYRGYHVIRIQHKHFKGDADVYAIDVQPPIYHLDRARLNRDLTGDFSAWKAGTPVRCRLLEDGAVAIERLHNPDGSWNSVTVPADHITFDLL